MSRKPIRGTRSPSTRLNDTVNQLSEGEFEDVLTILSVNPRTPKYLELIQWHRGKQPYETLAEKAAFEGYDLNSLREKSIKFLDAAISELKLGLPGELVTLADRIDQLSHAEQLQALEITRSAKAHAIKRAYLGRLVKLLEVESKILSGFLSGIERTVAIQKLKAEQAQAVANLELAPRIIHYRTEFLDKVVAQRNKTGALDKELVGAYLASDFAKLDVSDYPPLLIGEKMLMDEVFHALGGDLLKASQIAESVWAMDQLSYFLSPLSRAKLMVRLNDYYIALGDRKKGEQLIAQFATFDPESTQNRVIYLIRYLVAILEWAAEGDGYLSVGNAQKIFERNRDFVLDSPIGGNRSRILIAMMVIYIGSNELVKAKEILDSLYREKDQKPPMFYRICFMICHLMILFDLKEVEDLKHHSKNYREFMGDKGEIAVPAIDLLQFLQKNARRYANPRPSEPVKRAYIKDVKCMIDKLEKHRIADSEVRVLFYSPSINWLTAKLD